MKPIYPHFKPNSKVRIVSGYYKNYPCLYIKSLNKKEALVRIYNGNDFEEFEKTMDKLSLIQEYESTWFDYYVSNDKLNYQIKK